MCLSSIGTFFMFYFKEAMFMFFDIGKKIKVLAGIFMVVGIIASVIMAIVMFSAGYGMEGFGFAWLIGGSLVSVISGFFMYGFGELIDKVTEIERNTRGGMTKSSVQAKKDDERIKKLENLRAQGLITEEEYRNAIEGV